ncbi:MAG: zinc-ribbon domain-containing protein, partial [Candidatus Bathyarchaeota archaeon]
MFLTERFEAENTKMVYCTKCGAKNADDSKICTQCGAS